MFFPSSKRVSRQLVRQASTNIKATFQSGFTLIELLVVIGLLAIIAGIAIVSYEGVQDQGRDDITRYEITEIRKALLQFRRDTGEFPCRVYREGVYAPDNIGIQIDFTGLPSSPSVDDYYQWCKNGHAAQVNWGLSLLLKFPYDNTDTFYTPLLWNPDTKRGWNGPYVSNQGLLDGWGNRFVLLDPELDYSPHYQCKEAGVGGVDYYKDGNLLYSCLTADIVGFDGTYTKPADIARLVSFGPNGVYEGDNNINPCLPADVSDDLVLCLLR